MSRRLTVNDQYSLCDWPVQDRLLSVSLAAYQRRKKERVFGEKKIERKYSGYDKQGKQQCSQQNVIIVRSMIGTTITELPYEIKSEIFNRIPVQGKLNLLNLGYFLVEVQNHSFHFLNRTFEFFFTF